MPWVEHHAGTRHKGRLAPRTERYAKNGDMRILAAMAQRYLAVAEEHYRARRYFQAAETAAVSNRLVEAIQHIYWSDAGSRSQGSLPPPSRKPWDRLEGKDHLTPGNLGGAKNWTHAPTS